MFTLCQQSRKKKKKNGALIEKMHVMLVNATAQTQGGCGVNNDEQAFNVWQCSLPNNDHNDQTRVGPGPGKAFPIIHHASDRRGMRDQESEIPEGSPSQEVSDPPIVAVRFTCDKARMVISG